MSFESIFHFIAIILITIVTIATLGFTSLGILALMFWLNEKSLGEK